MRRSPKTELIETLDTMAKILNTPEPSPIQLVQIKGLVEYAQGLAPLVGESARPRKERTT